MNKICALGAPGRYVVISADEFFEDFPEGGEKSSAELKKALKTLITDGYIDVKYSGGEMICVCPLKNYVPEPPALPDDEIAPDFSAQYDGAAKISTIPILVAALTGGIIGGAVGSAIVSLIFYFL